jgi:hypothetical protein
LIDNGFTLDTEKYDLEIEDTQTEDPFEDYLMTAQEAYDKSSRMFNHQTQLKNIYRRIQTSICRAIGGGLFKTRCEFEFSDMWVSCLNVRTTILDHLKNNGYHAYWCSDSDSEIYDLFVFWNKVENDEEPQLISQEKT